MDDDEFGFSAKFQQFINEGKWREVKKYLTDYVVGYKQYNKDTNIDLTKCYVVVYEVLKNE